MPVGASEASNGFEVVTSDARGRAQLAQNPAGDSRIISSIPPRTTWFVGGHRGSGTETRATRMANKNRGASMRQLV